MSSRPQDVEILIHASAPSLIASDASYRQLAQAYLDFEPGDRTFLPERPGSLSNSLNSVRSGQAGSQQPVSQRRDLQGSSKHPIAIDSQDLSFQSVLDNRLSPHLAAHTQQRFPISELEEAANIVPSSLVNQNATQHSWSTPPSQINDSYPMPGAGVYISPTKVLLRYLSERPSSKDPVRTVSPLTHSDPEALTVPSSAFSVQDQDNALFPRNAYHNETVPVTPLTIGIPKHSRDEENREDETPWDITHISDSDPGFHQPGPSPRAESEPPPSKKTRQIKPATAVGRVKQLVRSASDPAATKPTSSSSLSTQTTNHDALEIRPPSPPVGIGILQPHNLISEKLAKLAVDLSSRYRPSVSRDVQPLERGHWLLNCTSWSEERWYDTWEFLTSYLESGLAGWGVWCCRDEARQWLKLYCWGHVAKHTYLLLYLASERILKSTGAQWRDAEGEVVIKVPPYERQT